MNVGNSRLNDANEFCSLVYNGKLFHNLAPENLKLFRKYSVLGVGNKTFLFLSQRSKLSTFELI